MNKIKCRHVVIKEAIDSEEVIVGEEVIDGEEVIE